MNVKFFVGPKGRAPTKSYESDAGWDIYAAETTTFWDRGAHPVLTDLRLGMSYGWEAQIRPRSSNLTKKGLIVEFGTVDAGYRGEILVVCRALPGQEVYIQKGDRIAQIVFAPVIQATWEQVAALSDLPESERGGNGHGSSGR